MRRDPSNVAVTLAAALFVGCGDVPADIVHPIVPPRALAEVPQGDWDGGRPRLRLEASANVGLIIPDLSSADCDVMVPGMDRHTPLYLVPLTLAVAHECDEDALEPIMAPDGHHVTVGEWLEARGRVHIMCKDGGTRYRFQLRGLIPHGVYTIWHFPGTGAGALASRMGDIRNVFNANHRGVAMFETFGTAGSMTFFGEVPACTLPVHPDAGQLANELFVLVYHTDHRDWGPFPGPEATTVAHVLVLAD